MDKEFCTTDVDLAAYLRVKGLRYRIAPNPEKPNIADFIFVESSDLFAYLVEWHTDTEMHEFSQRRRKMYREARRTVGGVEG